MYVTNVDLSSHDLHLFYVSLHQFARKYKEEFKVFNNKKILENKKTRKPRSVEMDNFQDPQVCISVILAWIVLFLS